MEIKIKLLSSATTKTDTEQAMKGCKQLKFVKTSGGRRRYKEMADFIYSGNVYAVTNKVAYYPKMEI